MGDGMLDMVKVFREKKAKSWKSESLEAPLAVERSDEEKYSREDEPLSKACRLSGVGLL
jgi:hypothetical protein